MALLHTIRPCLWFDDQAEQAAEFYTGVFENSRVLRTTRYGPDMPVAEGTVLTVEFELDGARFTALNGGDRFTFDEAVSFQVICRDQAESDHYWYALVDGGEESQCGWLRDRFGLSWQVYPEELDSLVWDSEPERAYRATQAMLTMRRIDLEAVRRAADGV
ncbi:MULTISPECIES: VOC family protein [unclassified Nocardiopsis]|uniref:VOC family protein n=1 Tax=unclassified Nocardiopsis TaxID=2649073 RepID=UPI0033DC538B